MDEDDESSLLHLHKQTQNAPDSSSYQVCPPASLPHSPREIVDSRSFRLRDEVSVWVRLVLRIAAQGGGADPAAAAPATEDEEEERRRWTGRRRKRRRGAAAEWKLSLCAISEDVGVVTMGRVGGGGERKKKAVGPAPEPERSASRKRSGGSYTRVHDRVFNGDEYDQRGASFQAVIPAFSPAPFMF